MNVTNSIPANFQDTAIKSKLIASIPKAAICPLPLNLCLIWFFIIKWRMTVVCKRSQRKCGTQHALLPSAAREEQLKDVSEKHDESNKAVFLNCAARVRKGTFTGKQKSKHCQAKQQQQKKSCDKSYPQICHLCARYASECLSASPVTKRNWEYWKVWY